MSVASGYAETDIVPYHNFMHAVDVAVTLHHLFRKVHAPLFVGRHQRLALIASALAHDIGHCGYTNDFLINTHDEIALRYNDCSPLESMHCAKLFDIVSKPGAAIFGNLEQAVQREVRQVCVEAILYTDNQRHFGLVKELETVYDMNRDLFSGALPTESEDSGSSNGARDATAELSADVVEFFSVRGENVRLLQRFFVHFADQSNSMKSFHMSESWASKMFAEFFLQGDRERDLGLPVHPLRDRHTLNRPLAQANIIELCIAPMSMAASLIMPGLLMCEDMLFENLDKWLDEWKETGPSEDDWTRVSERINKLRLYKP